MSDRRQEVLVDTEWLAAHADDPTVRIVEVDVDTQAYEEGHVPGAIAWNWTTDLCDTVERDIVPREELDALLSRSGIGRETTIALYGDNNNWFACWAFWQLEIYGHPDVRVVDGGRRKWLLEGRELTREVPDFAATEYRAEMPDFAARAFLEDVQAVLRDPDWSLVDVRSADEFSGRLLAPPGLPETCQRGGHIPGAVNIPWGANCNEDGTFKSRRELEELYSAAGVGDGGVIAYCRIGERSSLTWFVLRYLLGRSRVLNYDGSWTEWGNLVRAPVERGAAAR